MAAPTAMPRREVWSRTREKLRSFPHLMAACAAEASAYGRCVAANTQGSKDLRKDKCANEFQALKNCFTVNAKKAR
ncbi:NADH dehydrogenase [ubiquinone] 1 alpha subcomplex assembly factor 8 [Chiloscyllium plagiosum]|uniref:NADH dehydrogenase [ubiquinone] 1 alpha subcomplex assembly factor 8 n=1 Tax=Chiloscyllium plagiosum TaxID=36176 RepID=UPI001CB7DD99|nr:NADH dehydrogenase [ubiquinone] 1 alpha subcomplex assembly factor 8 [Chiloscyllium plagiosum]